MRLWIAFTPPDLVVLSNREMLDEVDVRYFSPTAWWVAGWSLNDSGAYIHPLGCEHRTCDGGRQGVSPSLSAYGDRLGDLSLWHPEAPLRAPGLGLEAYLLWPGGFLKLIEDAGSHLLPSFPAVALLAIAL